jgi:menaquinone-dependent protoporphyrinogen oxidase
LDVFVGKLDPAELGLAERLLVKMVHGPSGDFRDWEAVRNWGGAIAQHLHTAVA